MKLSAGFAALALRIQEALTSDLSNSDVMRRLSDCLQEQSSGSGMWCYCLDYFGDADAGDVIYCCGGDTFRAPYTFTTVDGKVACSIDMNAAIEVMPRTVYDEMAEDADHYAAMESEKLYAGDIPLYERFIAPAERAAAGSKDFAGKGKSFPILKAADVMAAVRAMSKAGPDNYKQDVLKKNIIRIAKAKGFEDQLPKSWRSDGAKESQPAAAAPGVIRLVEAIAPDCLPAVLFAEAGVMSLREAFADALPIKLIAPGAGSSAFYTEEMLKRDGPVVFKAGTPMRIDHPTKAEEAARPEGSVKDWAAVLGKDAYWLDSGPRGPGLYSEVKPFSDHAVTLKEKGPYAAVSIAAYGEPLLGPNGKPVMREGKTVLARLTSADGVDMVTRAGAGGMFLSEAARSANPNNNSEENEMDAAEFKKLQESLTLREANEKRLLERAIRGDARELAAATLKPISLHESGKALVLEHVLGTVEAPRPLPLTEAGELDSKKFLEALDAEAKRVGAVIAQATGSGNVRGMGTAPAAAVDVKVQEAADAARADKAKRLRESSVKAYMDIGLPRAAAEAAADRGAAQIAAA
jgi:hypothetical protein